MCSNSTRAHDDYLRLLSSLSQCQLSFLQNKSLGKIGSDLVALATNPGYRDVLKLLKREPTVQLEAPL